MSINGDRVSPVDARQQRAKPVREAGGARLRGIHMQINVELPAHIRDRG